jgi:hypothetical protein
MMDYKASRNVVVRSIGAEGLFLRVLCNEAVALIEKTKLLRRLEVQLLLQVLAGAAAQLVKDMVVSLALGLEAEKGQRE